MNQSDMHDKPHKKGQSMTAYNTLRLNQSLLVADWLKTKAEYEPGTPHQSIAEEATTALGFTVTVSNLKTVADAVGFTLPPARKPKTDPLAEMQARIDEIELKLDVQTHRMGTMIDDILKLQARLQTVDPWVPGSPDGGGPVINTDALAT